MDGPGPGDGASPSEKKSVDESPIPQLPPHIPATEPQELSGLKRNLMILALGLGIFVGILVGGHPRPSTHASEAYTPRRMPPLWPPLFPQWRMSSTPLNLPAGLDLSSMCFSSGDLV